MSRSVTISPAALFQIIKDIKNGPGVDHAQGRLYGMPSDGRDDCPIEVTHAFPNYSKKEFGQGSRPDNITSINDEKSFSLDHMKAVKKLNFDAENVGWYTSQSCGRRFNFKDLAYHQSFQKEDPTYFCLVVDLSESSLSLRAFRISDRAMEYIEKTHGLSDNLPYIDESMFFNNLLEEYNVSFSLSRLDMEITTFILSSFNLIADVFKLRDPSTFEGNVPLVSEAIDEIENNMNFFSSEKNEMRKIKNERIIKR